MTSTKYLLFIRVEESEKIRQSKRFVLKKRKERERQIIKRKVECGLGNENNRSYYIYRM